MKHRNRALIAVGACLISMLICSCAQKVLPTDAVSSLPQNAAMLVDVNTDNGAALLLTPKSKIEWTSVPANRAGALKGAYVTVGTYAGAGTGNLMMEVCTPSDCQRGAADISKFKDNLLNSVMLEKPLNIAAGDVLTFTFSRTGGGRFAIWAYTPLVSKGALVASGRTVNGRSLRVAAIY